MLFCIFNRETVEVYGDKNSLPPSNGTLKRSKSYSNHQGTKIDYFLNIGFHRKIPMKSIGVIDISFANNRKIIM